jgi:transposase
MTEVMRPNRALPQVFLYREPIDFRKSFNGLAAIIDQELGRNPFAGELYAFINRRRSKIKCLFWEHNGFVLYYKSLTEEKFHWPKQTIELITLTGEQFNWLLDGYNLNAMQAHRKIQVDSLF